MGSQNAHSYLVNIIPVLALTERWTLGFRESNCFLRGPGIIMEINNYRISDNLVTTLIIVYILILLCPDYTECFVNIWRWHQKFNTSPIGLTQIFLTLLYPGQTVTALFRPYAVTNTPVLIYFQLLASFSNSLISNWLSINFTIF